MTSMNIECINERESDVIGEKLIKVGEQYKLDLMSVYGDNDGDWYGCIYDDNGNFIMSGKLSHFKSL